MVSLSSYRWKRTRAAAIARAGRRCERCGRPGALEGHHKVPRSVDASEAAVFDLANIEVLCRDCHIREHEREPCPGEEAWAGLVDELLCS